MFFLDVNTGGLSEKVGLYICNVIFVGVGRELAILLHQQIRVHESNTVISETDWSNLLGMVILPNKQDTFAIIVPHILLDLLN